MRLTVTQKPVRVSLSLSDHEPVLIGLREVELKKKVHGCDKPQEVKIGPHSERKNTTFKVIVCK